MSTTIMPVPIQTPMVDDRGLVTTHWAAFFERIRSRRIAASSGAGALVDETTLTADTSIVGPGAPAADGDLLQVVIIQDATGGWEITWGADFATGIPTTVALKADAVTVFGFFGWGGVWWPAAPAIFSEP